ncbi:unnamed protein product, partial [Ixodes persulcatus]
MMRIYRKVLRSPKSRVRDCLPYVGMFDPFAATRCEPACVGGITHISAPVSTRKWRPVIRFVTKKQRLVVGPTSLAASSDGAERFPAIRMAVGTYVRRYRISGGTSRE